MIKITIESRLRVFDTYLIPISFAKYIDLIRWLRANGKNIIRIVELK
jgi:hypothetical protein